MNKFLIKLLHIHWIEDDGKDDPKDLCAHGKVLLIIGDELISNEKSNSWTVSSAALHLMRTVFQNYKPGDYYSQLIPCCGHEFYPSKDRNTVTVGGCPNGINWTVEHLDGDLVKLTTFDEKIVIIPLIEYISSIRIFANNVESFYETSQEKDLNRDLETKIGYLVFWREWRTLKSNLKNL